MEEVIYLSIFKQKLAWLGIEEVDQAALESPVDVGHGDDQINVLK